MNTKLKIDHPHQAGAQPRTLFLAARLFSVAAVAASMAGLTGLFRLDLAVWVAGGCLAVPAHLSSRWLRARAWAFVPPADQQGAAEPWWMTLTHRGAQLGLVVATIGYGATISTAWSAGVALGIAGVLTGALLVRVSHGVRDRVLQARWRAWRVVDAAVLTLTTTAVVVALAAELDATTRMVTVGLVLPTMVAALLGAVAAVPVMSGFQSAGRAALGQA